MRIACAQLAPVLGDGTGNMARALSAIAGCDADVVVLPELCLSGYAFESEDEARAGATPVGDLEVWSTAGRVVVGGFAELGGDGRLYNAAAVVDGGGVRAVYRKAHLWAREPRWFAAGDAEPPVVATAAGRVAPLVCFDLFFPEWVRVAALAGAELVCVPGNWPRGSERPPVQLLRARVAAEANAVAVATCDRAGEERGALWAGASGVVAPDGTLVAAADGFEPQVVTGVVGRAAPPSLRAARRPELYGRLLSP